MWYSFFKVDLVLHNIIKINVNFTKETKSIVPLQGIKDNASALFIAE